MAITRALKVGETVTQEELRSSILVKVTDTPIADGVEIVRVSFLYLGYERGFVAIHFGAADGPMSRNPGQNPRWAANPKIEAIYEPQKK